MYLFNIKAKGHEGHLHCSTLTLQYKFKQQYAAAYRQALQASAGCRDASSKNLKSDFKKINCGTIETSSINVKSLENVRRDRCPTVLVWSSK